jgi:hypothetical protein
MPIIQLQDEKDHSFRPTWGKTPSQPIFGHGGLHLSSQLWEKYKKEDHGPGWPGHKCETLAQKQPKHWMVVAHTYNYGYLEAEIRRIAVPALGK